MTTCACGCGREVLSARASYYSGKCRLKVSQQKRALVPATVRTRRTLKSGKVQFILHAPPLWAGAIQKGDNVVLNRSRK